MGFSKILVVDDEPVVQQTLARVLKRLPAEVLSATCVKDALALLSPEVDLVITDVAFEFGSGIDVAVAACKLRPSPVVIAISGAARAADGVALGKAGVSAYIAKPFTTEDLLQVVRGLEGPRHLELDAAARRVVGDWPLPEVLDAVRRSMVFEALARSNGNKVQAAQMLGISRQHLQNILARGKV